MKNNTIQKIIVFIITCICFVPATFIIFVWNLAEFLNDTVSNVTGYQPNANKKLAEPPKGTFGEDA